MTFKVREICENLWQIFYQTEIFHNIIEENPQNRYQKKICQSISTFRITAHKNGRTHPEQLMQFFP